MLCALFVANAAAIDVNDPPQGTFADEWYVVQMAGQKSGHANNTMERITHKGVDAIRSTTKMSLTMKRGGAGVTVSVTQKSIETLDAKPLSFSNTMRLGAVPITTTGEIKDGKVTLRKRQMGIAAEPSVYDVPEGAMMSWGLYKEQIKRGLKPGTKYELSLYEPTLAPDRLLPAKMEILDAETIDLFGRTVSTVKAKQLMKIPNPLGGGTEMETVMWLTEDGDPLKVQMEMMNIPIVMLATTKSVALAPDDPAELMITTLIHVDGEVDRDAASMRYKISIGDAEGQAKLPEVPTTGMQQIEATDDEGITLKVVRSVLAQPRGVKEPLTEEGRRRFLRSSGTLNFKDPEVAKLAKQAADGEKDVIKLADKLRRFVSEFITDKNLEVGFATASEVARSREGDCSEHGVLLAALGRAHNIPTRLVTELVYVPGFDGEERVFGGHLWTQFYLDGRWVDLDAAQNQSDVDAGHIALSLADGGDTGVADMVNSLWLNLGKMQIKVLPQE